MCFGLYNQFDLHPEKEIDGEFGISGLKFYFWDQSFGRITGISKWNNDKSFLYLFYFMLVMVFPYSILTIVAYGKGILGLLKGKYKRELVSLGGSLVILIMLSFSSYKIPHYAIVVLPFISILVAHEIEFIDFQKNSKWIKAHHVLAVSLIFLISAVSFMIFEAV